jgi:hypothetical protein
MSVSGLVSSEIVDVARHVHCSINVGLGLVCISMYKLKFSLTHSATKCSSDHSTITGTSCVSYSVVKLKLICCCY